MVFLALGVACAVAFALAWRGDRRVLRSGALLSAAVFAVVVGVVDLVSPAPALEDLRNALEVLFSGGVVVLAGFLFGGGARVFQQGGRGRTAVLYLVAGVALVVATAVLAVLRPLSVVAEALLLLLVAVAGTVGVVLLVFLLAAVLYTRSGVPLVADVVVVLGSGLDDGQVPAVLRSRLDRGVDVLRQSAEAGRRPIVIPSGGQGADEPRAEAEAMAEYLVEQGVPEQMVHPETAATNTEENLRFAQDVQARVGVDGTVLVVTSNYHVLRAALLARRIGSGAQVLGAPTPGHRLPGSVLREVAAVVVAHPVLHGVVLVVVLAGWAYVVGAGLL